MDAHSDNSLNIIQNLSPCQYIVKALIGCNPDVIVLPDSGAKRYKNIGALEGYDFIECEKVRDQTTGYITDFEMNECADGKDCLIVDDICDGGMTFILCAKALYKRGARRVALYTTHGIYSKGLNPLRAADIGPIYNRKGTVPA